MAVGVGRLAVTSRFAELYHLGKNPRVRSGRASDHHGVAIRLFRNSSSVFRFLNIAIPDHRNAHGLLHRRDDLPVCLPAIPLQARTWMKDRKSTRLNSSHVAIS